MGVLSCTRISCPNIMCDTYINGIGYICSDCQREFKDHLVLTNKNPKTEWEIVKELEVFIHTTKGLFDNISDISVDEFFRNNTK